MIYNCGYNLGFTTLRAAFFVKVLFLAQFGLVAHAEASSTPDAGDEQVDARSNAKSYSPYAGRNYPVQVYFGDTHHHTANSGDAFLNGDRLGPERAYRFARGEEVVSSTGIPVKLARPLDFLVISDHAEGLGVMYEVYNGNPLMMADSTLARWNKMMKVGGSQAAEAQNELVAAQAGGTLPGPLTNPEVAGPLQKTVWRDYTKAAEDFNDPGRFTAIIGFEWSAVPDGNNLHRNVLFRDSKDRADQVAPFTSWESENPEDLWEWMAQYETKTGGRVLAIPHNGNLSNGRMFASTDFVGEPLTKEYARKRARWEPLQEVMQTKGNSETHPTLSPTDEFSNFGIAGWDYGNLTMQGEPESPGMRPYMYIRGGLMNGLAHYSKLGINPFKFGMIGGTDVHNSLTAIDEDNFFGKHVVQEPSRQRWEHISKQGFGKTRYTWHYSAAGYAAIWATSNTREALWDALHRKEVYATSGNRPTVRFFGGWHFSAEDATSRYIASIGYDKGVPMGGDLPTVTDSARGPTFLVAAMKDPMGGNLDRIQIIKGWLDAKGKTREAIYNVAWGDAATRKLDRHGKLPPVGDTVDIENATWRNSIGDAELAVAWEDPDFDASEPSFYYARVIDIPTPRWTAYDQKRFDVEMSSEVPMKHQERAWTSPIWYNPDS